MSGNDERPKVTPKFSVNSRYIQCPKCGKTLKVYIIPSYSGNDWIMPEVCDCEWK